MRLMRYIKRPPEKIKEKIKVLLERPDFNSAVNNIRKKYKIYVNAPDDQFEKLLWNDSFDLDITSLVRSLALSERWRDWLYKFIIENDQNSNFDPDAAIIEEDIKEGTEEPEFFIRVFSHTTGDEVRQALRIIKKLQNNKNVRTKKSKNFDRDLRILRLAQNGKNIRDIYKEFAKEGLNLDYGQIKTIVSRQKRKLNIQAMPKLKTSK